MSFTLWLVLFFFALLFLSLLVYVLVVKAFYWGDKTAPPAKKAPKQRSSTERPQDHQ